MSSLKEREFSRYKEHFALFDEDSDGNLNPQCLGSCLRSLGFFISNEELKRISQNKTMFNFSDLLSLTASMYSLEKPEGEQIKDLEEAFNVFDLGGTGLVSVSRVRKVLTNLGEPLTEDEIKKLEDRFMSDQIDMETFINHLMSRA